MTTHVIVCPYCHGTCPVDARFCIECSASLLQAVTHTTHRLSGSPAPLANTSRATADATSTSERTHLSFIGTVLGGLLVLIAALANRTPQFDSVAALILTLGVVQFVRGTMRGQVIAGLRAAVIGVVLTLAMITPWVLTICIVASALLVTLQLVDTRGISNHRRP
jgi:hypothetical protein